MLCEVVLCLLEIKQGNHKHQTLPAVRNPTTPSAVEERSDVV